MPVPPESDPSPSSQGSGCEAGSAGQAKALRASAPRAYPWLLVTGCVIALLALMFWRPLQRKCTAWFLLQAAAPSEEVLADAVEPASDPGALLAQLWHTQRVPHRQFVLRYLFKTAASKPDLFRQMDWLVGEAAKDPDFEVRELALGTLARLKRPQLRPLALAQLADADPAVRLIGLRSLRGIATSNDVPIAIGFLNDPEPRVAVAAALVLRQATGQDFGVKSTQAIPQFTCIGTNPPPAPDLPVIQQGIGRWQRWWAAHQSEYPPVPPFSAPDSASSLAAPDFKLPDCGGKTVQLSQFLGKSVWLVFWSSGAPASLDDVPALNALYERHAGRLAVLGICLPAAQGCCGGEEEHGHGEDHDHAHHHHAETSGSAQDLEQFRAAAQQAAERLKIRFPMLLDPEGKVGPRFSAEDLPVCVLMDAQGKIRRRFVGFRSEQALAAMVEGTTN